MIAAAVSVAGHVATPRAVTIPRTTTVTSVARTGKRKTDVMTCARLHVKTAAAAPHARKRVRMSARKAHPPARKIAVRSEEHTSELQSRGQLVCRLLREKKK